MTEDIDINDTLDAAFPETLRDHSEVLARVEDGEPLSIDMFEVLDQLHLVYTHPMEVVSYLLKVRQGLCNMAYVLEEYFARSEDAFRVWRADLGRGLNSKDESKNPLLKEGSKTTNNAIQSYLRSQPEYEQFKNKIASIEASKNMLWTAKQTLDRALDLITSTHDAEELPDVNVVTSKSIDEGRARLEKLADDLVKSKG